MKGEEEDRDTPEKEFYSRQKDFKKYEHGYIDSWKDRMTRITGDEDWKKKSVDGNN